MEVQSTQKYIHIAPRKLRLVSDMVRRLRPVEAIRVLRFTNKAAAGPLAKAIKTALANAKQQNVNQDELVFKALEVNEGFKMRRFIPSARGRVRPFKKRTSHIKIVLTDEVPAKQRTAASTVKEPSVENMKATEELLEKEVKVEKVAKPKKAAKTTK